MRERPVSPTVSIIIPCYKQAHFLPVTLASVQSQTLTDWECLIVDDGSPDETETVAKTWLGKDVRFRYLRKENGGLSSARNFGIHYAKGHFVQFLDSDDVILPKKLQIQVEQLADGPSHSLSFCDYTRGCADDIYKAPNPPAPYLPPILDETTSIYELVADWETRLSIPAHCFLFNRVFFDEGIAFDEALTNHEDWDCWVRIFYKSRDIKFCPEKLAIYRYHAESMCRNLTKMRDGYLQAIDKHLSDQMVDRDIKAILRIKRSEMRSIYELKLNKKPLMREKVYSLLHKIAKPFILDKEC
jgi:hypothetical protein